MSFIDKQVAKFQVFDAPAQRILKANFIYYFFFPFFILFSQAYVYANSPGGISYNVFWGVMHFIGNPLGYLVCGYFLRRFEVKTMYAAGMIIMALNMWIMMLIPQEYFNATACYVFGFISGIGSGMYWSSRFYLTIVSTKDETRNLFNGIDFMFQIISGIVMPITVGTYISLYENEGFRAKFEFFTQQFAYISAGLVAVLLALAASAIIVRGSFKTVKLGRFLHFSFSPEWKSTRFFAFIMGCYHAGIICLPTIVTLRFIGGEGALGLIDTVAHVLALITIYIASTISRPEDRPKIMLLGAAIFAVGIALFTGSLATLPVYAAVITSVAFYLSDPTMNFPYRASFMKSIDLLRVKENRGEFTYLCDIEIFNAIGRVVSILAFFVLYQVLPEKTSFITYFIGLAILQFINVVLCKRINNLKTIF